MAKNVLITGASSGLGLEFARIFAEAEFNLILVARSRDKMEQFADEYPEVDMKIIQKDLSKPGSAQEVAEEVEKAGIDVDILINNAGFGLHGAFHELPLSRLTEMMHLNMLSLTELTHLLLPSMIERNSGRILNVASVAGFVPIPYMSVYAATKAFVLAFTEGLAEELSDTNITLSVLCPGPTETNFSKTANADKTKMFEQAMSARAVADEGINGLLNGKRVIVTGKTNKATTLAAKWIPRSTTARIAKSVTRSK